LRFVLATKAAVAVAAGLAITFSQSHNSAVGLLVFAIFAIAYAILVSAFSLRFEPSRYFGEELVVSIASLTLGVFALLNQGGGLALFSALVGIWAIILAANEAYLGWRSRPNGSKSRDHMISSGLAIVLGVILLLVPIDAVSAVGFFGAYLVLSSVHLAIAAFSPKG